MIHKKIARYMWIISIAHIIVGVSFCLKFQFYQEIEPEGYLRLLSIFIVVLPIWILLPASVLGIVFGIKNAKDDFNSIGLWKGSLILSTLSLIILIWFGVVYLFMLAYQLSYPLIIFGLAITLALISSTNFIRPDVSRPILPKSFVFVPILSFTILHYILQGFLRYGALPLVGLTFLCIGGIIAIYGFFIYPSSLRRR